MEKIYGLYDSKKQGQLEIIEFINFKNRSNQHENNLHVEFINWKNISDKIIDDIDVFRTNILQAFSSLSPIIYLDNLSEIKFDDFESFTIFCKELSKKLSSYALTHYGPSIEIKVNASNIFLSIDFYIKQTQELDQILSNIGDAVLPHEQEHQISIRKHLHEATVSDSYFQYRLNLEYPTHKTKKTRISDSVYNTEYGANT